ncbi:hypothetical protein NWE55_10415 [Myroides albus]|uniref:Uncharacterized protein n=1 Tax=Myroides albus TaxID=2562892 RepID=A0A6I3LLG9_9FLAO|nr:hypothetical protein [Myroides albus]MTG97032.1 hypothetical protein [Myroides albus]UVD78544.1 hypothetical protein NWE55_10415 [Myroides albus]
MNIGDRLINWVDCILAWFDRIKGFLSNAVAFFEKLKDLILEYVEYFTKKVDEYTEEELQLLEEEHFFI